MGDHLQAVVADYTLEELAITPQGVLSDSPEKIQEIYVADDGTINVTSYSTNTFFDVRLEWELLTLTEADFLESLWASATKANGSERTFYWVHPSDGYTYTVRFMGPFSREQKGHMCSYRSIKSVVLRVEGVKP